MPLLILQVALVAIGLAMAAGTLLSLSRNPHWFIRGWDFPRMQILVLLLLAGVPYAVLYWPWSLFDAAFLLAVAAAAAWQCVKIFPYLPVAPRQVKRGSTPTIDGRLRLVVSNVMVENKRHDRWLDVIRASDPDVILAVEVDRRWSAALSELKTEWPHCIEQPQENYYGIALYSRLDLVDPQVRFLVQDDVPSVHVGVKLRSGQVVRFHGVHPRPPEPVRDQSAAPRDAELVIVGREIAREKTRVPTIVAGDLNDVAWSGTTQLFIHLSGALDPRRGRGLFNTWNANSRLFRFPLDHVFHTNDFTLIELRRLEHVGSDHFPMLIELQHEPQAEAEQPEPEKSTADEREASEKIERQQERELEGEEQGHLSGRNAG